MGAREGVVTLMLAIFPSSSITMSITCFSRVTMGGGGVVTGGVVVGARVVGAGVVHEHGTVCVQVLGKMQP